MEDQNQVRMSDPQILNNIRLMLDDRRFEDLIQLFDRMDISSADPIWQAYYYQKKAFCFEKLNKKAEAFACYEKSIPIEKELGFYSSAVGKVAQLVEKNKYDEALQILNGILIDYKTSEEDRVHIQYNISIVQEKISQQQAS